MAAVSDQAIQQMIDNLRRDRASGAASRRPSPDPRGAPPPNAFDTDVGGDPPIKIVDKVGWGVGAEDEGDQTRQQVPPTLTAEFLKATDSDEERENAVKSMDILYGKDKE